MHTVDRNTVEECRAALLKLIISPMTPLIVRQKDVIKNLMPEIIAAREHGISFEWIEETFRPYGLLLKADTIREYFYEELPQQDAESLREKALRYKKAAQEAIRQFDAKNDKNLGDCIKKAIDEEAAKGKPSSKTS